MADETGKTVISTLRILIDQTQAEEQAKKLGKILDDLNKKSNLGGRGGSGGGGSGGGGSGGGGGRKPPNDEDVYRRAALNNWRLENRVAARQEKAEKAEERKKDIAAEREIAQIKRTADRYLRQDNRMEARVLLRAEREAAREAQKKQSAQGSLAVQSLAMMGAGGIAEKIGRYQTYGMALKNAGYARGGALLGGASGGGTGIIGKAGIAAIAAETAFEGAKAWAKSGLNPYARSDQRNSLFMQEMFPTTMDAYTLFNGIQREGNLSVSRSNIRGMEQSGATRAQIMGLDLTKVSHDRASQAEGFKNYAVAGLPTANRTTALGAVQYQEQLKMQPLLQNQKRAESDLAVARLNSTKATERLAEAEKAANKQELEAYRLDGIAHNLRGVSNSPKAIEAQGFASAALQASMSLNDDVLKRRKEEQAARADYVNAQQGVRSASTAVERGKLENLQAREQHATGQATNLGGMGPSGRMKGELALQMIVENGIDYATPDMISAAESVAPLTISNMKRDLGERYGSSSEILNKFAPEDYKEYGMASDLRKQVDASRSGVAGSEVENLKRTTEDLAKVYSIEQVKYFIEVVKTITEQEINKFKLDNAMNVSKKIANVE